MPIRQPTDDATKYAHWRARVAGEPVEIHETEYHAGFYEMAVGPKGPKRRLVAVEVILQSDVDFVTGELTEDETFLAWSEDGVIDLALKWTYLRPISRDRYDGLLARDRNIATVAAPPKANSVERPAFADISQSPITPPTF